MLLSLWILRCVNVTIQKYCALRRVHWHIIVTDIAYTSSQGVIPHSTSIPMPLWPSFARGPPAFHYEPASIALMWCARSSSTLSHLQAAKNAPQSRFARRSFSISRLIFLFFFSLKNVRSSKLSGQFREMFSTYTSQSSSVLLYLCPISSEMLRLMVRPKPAMTCRDS